MFERGSKWLRQPENCPALPTACLQAVLWLNFIFRLPFFVMMIFKERNDAPFDV